MVLRRILFLLTSVSGFIFLLHLQSCRQDDFDADPSLTLEFSADSLLFDTVFTTVGSSTRFFKVYNKHNSRIRISSVELAGGSASFFRINVDGRSGTHIRDVEIGPRDSLFVFVEVTVDPLGTDLPLVISDSVVFQVNNNVQDVKLVAWGQDAHFIKPDIYDADLDVEYHLITENTIWSGPKPWVIYGLLLIAPDVTLTIEEGTSVHLHHQSAMIFTQRSSLVVDGSLDHPVTIQGDRLESGYQNLPGQWGYIWFSATSGVHDINYAVIKNGTYGIVMDSIASFTEPTLRIRNTIIKNMDQTGLELNGAWVEANNLVVANCGVHAIKMSFGGNYDFSHVTVANYYSLPGAIRQTPSVSINNYFMDTLGVVHVRELEKVRFANSIIYGSLQDELFFDVFPDASEANALFEYSLVRTVRQSHPEMFFENSLFNQQPRFLSVSENDYRLQEDSPVIGQASLDIAADVPLDILGNSRMERADMGAYQYYEIEDEDDEED